MLIFYTPIEKCHRVVGGPNRNWSEIPHQFSLNAFFNLIKYKRHAHILLLINIKFDIQ